MRLAAIAFSIVVLFGATLYAQSEQGSVCVAPPPTKDWADTSAFGYACPSGQFSLRIDDRKVLSWSNKESVRTDPLPLTGRHRVVIYCNGKPHQSFTFSFSNFKTKDLCLFLDDTYKTAQLWELKQAPWCKCS